MEVHRILFFVADALRKTHQKYVQDYVNLEALMESTLLSFPTKMILKGFSSAHSEKASAAIHGSIPNADNDVVRRKS